MFRPAGAILLTPSDGQGLNPLLRHPGMIIHPPMLYLGFVSFVIPYAFAIAALITGRTDDRWIRLTRRWTLVAWLFLSLGLVLGARWDAVPAEVPGREVVVGAATRPWEPVVTFRPVAPESFAAFAEPDYVKIVWTLRADPVGDGETVFRTETRVVATDPTARAKFRRYWRFFSPGIIAIRWLLLRPLKAEAERRARYATEDTNAPRA